MIKESADALVVTVFMTLGLVMIFIIGLMIYALSISCIPPVLTY